MELTYTDEIRDALGSGIPLVALESTVIAHGLPYPQNLEAALRCEAIVRGGGAVPATIGIIKGAIRVGLSAPEIEFLATADNVRKSSVRDLPVVVSGSLDGATTVSTTALIANAAGIGVFATGGIGGVHRGFSADVSADLPVLADTPITVVCSGPKVILDISATREWLETHGITVLGWQCDEMPAFYCRSSGTPVDHRVDSAAEAATIVAASRRLRIGKAALLTVPVPEEFELTRAEAEQAIAKAMDLSDSKGVSGKALTPFMLAELTKALGGRTLEANIALLENNARVAASVAVELAALGPA